MKTQFLTIFTLFVLLFVNCSKPETPPEPVKTIPTLTASIGTVTDNSIMVYGNITSDGNATITERGFYISTVAGEHTESATCTKLITGSGTGSFSNTYNGLISNTNYFITAYATNEKGTAFATELNQKTSIKVPIFNNLTVSTIKKTEATISFDLTPFEGSVPTEIGVEIYNTSSNGQPTGSALATLSQIINSSTIGVINFQQNFTNGSPGRKMFVKSYCKLTDNKYYGAETSFDHTGYYLGQNIAQGKVVMAWNDGSNGKLMANEMMKDMTVGGIHMPSYGFENLWVGATSENGLTNTEMLAAVNSNVPYGQPGYVNPNGVFKLAVAHTMEGVSSDFYIPTKADWEQIWANRVAIWGSIANLDVFFENGICYTSTEVDANHYYAFDFPNWSTSSTTGIFDSMYKMAYTDGTLKPSGYVICDLPVVVN